MLAIATSKFVLENVVRDEVNNYFNFVSSKNMFEIDLYHLFRSDKKYDIYSKFKRNKFLFLQYNMG